MPVIRIVFLWHMHQPFYKDLVTGEYKLPWVRLHALKDYYGMVKLLDEFPAVHQTFNLVPSLISQIQHYVSGTAKDPYWDVASKPAAELTPAERRFAVQYLFQANAENLIGRYPRFKELYARFSGKDFDANAAAPLFSTQDLADLQVLSQVAWFDESFIEGPLADPAIVQLIAKGRDFSVDDQKAVFEAERRILVAVLPAYKAAAEKGSAELSISPFYHPILPLICDSEQGRVSSPGLPLPQQQFRHPEDAAEQIRRGMTLHEEVFGTKPAGMWPSEGSVSDETIAIAQRAGICWMASDEGVLGRSLQTFFERSREGRLDANSAPVLYNVYRYENAGSQMNMIFRDHSLSDLIGFVYSGMPPADAAQHFLRQVKDSATSVLAQGNDAVVSVILDGENAWEFFPKSGREFLRRLYQAISDDPQLEATTVSEAIARHSPKRFGELKHVVPGSWINSNFNVWIGAPEDNRSWDCLSDARNFYSERSAAASPEQRALAYEELLIAEGSDWNWWYGPEHHTSNDADFDALYRTHLSNVYQALGGVAPEYLAQPIATFPRTVRFHPQTSYIRPRLDGEGTGYFDWLGAAQYISEHRDAAMHGKSFLLDSAHVGMDEDSLYVRIDFSDDPSIRGEGDDLIGTFDVVLIIENKDAQQTLRLDISLENGKLAKWMVGQSARSSNIVVALKRVLEVRIPFALLLVGVGGEALVRCSIWQNRLPLDALPAEGAIAIKRVPEKQLLAMAHS